MEEKGRRNDGLDAEGVGGCYVDCCWGFDDAVVVVALLVLEGDFREALMMMMLLLLIIARNLLIVIIFRSHSSIDARIPR